MATTAESTVPSHGHPAEEREKGRDSPKLQFNTCFSVTTPGPCRASVVSLADISVFTLYEEEGEGIVTRSAIHSGAGGTGGIREMRSLWMSGCRVIEK
jgi:hypothetical protein